MKNLLPDLESWRAAGDDVAIATVVRTWGSTPRPKGAKLAVSSSGKIAGSVSGGCLEAAVVEEANQVLASGKPRLLHYGITDEMAFDVGLSCGGELDIFVERLDW